MVPVAPMVPPRSSSCPAPRAAVAARAAALRALDPVVRDLVARHLCRGSGRPLLELTVYDVVYPATPAVGGHWTVATYRPLLLGHQVASYALTLEFDAAQRPARFRVCGAEETVSEDATPAALAWALAHAARGGPLRTWAPGFPPGISL
jgi:hypothetical protein